MLYLVPVRYFQRRRTRLGSRVQLVLFIEEQKPIFLLFPLVHITEFSIPYWYLPLLYHVKILYVTYRIYHMI